MEQDNFDTGYFDDDEPHPLYGTDDFSNASDCPRRGLKTGCVIGAIIGCGFAVLVCCGAVAILVVFVMNFLSKEVEAQLRDNPVLVEHLGEIESLEIDWTASFKKGDSDVFVFQVRGAKGRGELKARCITGADGIPQVDSATLHLPTGETHDIYPD